METAFYNAIKGKDTLAVKRLLEKFKHWHDSRPTDADADVFSSFSGIHYACYFHNKAALELLLKYQYNQLTQQDVRLPCKFISKSAKTIYLPAHSDCLFICVASDFLQGAKMILGFYQGKNAQYKHINRYGQSVLHLCALCRNSTAKYLLSQPQLLNLWPYQDESDQNTTFLALAAQAGRHDIFQQIDQDFASYNAQMKETCAVSLLFSNEYGEDLERYCYCVVDYEKFGTTREEKVKTAILASKLMKMAHKWLAKRDSIQAVRALQRWGEK